MNNPAKLPLTHVSSLSSLYPKTRQEKLEERRRNAGPGFYQQYINSEEWDKRRIKCLKAAKFQCQICGASNTPLHAHHNTYERLGDELPSDLIAVCESCHEIADMLREQREKSAKP